MGGPESDQGFSNAGYMAMSSLKHIFNVEALALLIDQSARLSEKLN